MRGELKRRMKGKAAREREKERNREELTTETHTRNEAAQRERERDKERVRELSTRWNQFLAVAGGEGVRRELNQQGFLRVERVGCGGLTRERDKER